MILGIDIETHSDVSIELGSEAYASDPSTDVHCVSLVLAPTKNPKSWVRQLWFPGKPEPQLWRDYVLGEDLFLAHNCGFERSILQHVLRKRHGWSWLPELSCWRDTIANAAALSLPTKLEGLALALGTEFQKDMAGNALMKECSKRAKLSPEERRRLGAYCQRDNETMLACWFRMPQLTQKELEVWFADRVINERGIPVDLDELFKIAKLRTERAEALKREAVRVSDLLTLRSNPALARWLGKHGIAIPKRMKLKGGVRVLTETLDVTAVRGMLKQKLPVPVRRLLEMRAELGKLSSLSKLSAFSRMSLDGRVHNALRYCAAHTGRWGGYGVQPHNLPHPRGKDWPERRAKLQLALDAGDLGAFAEVSPNVLEGLSLMLRSVIAAPPGFELLGADFSAIEAVGIAWLAGQRDVVGAFAEGRDVYIEDARKFGSKNRDMGKVARLSLGYGMGAVLFHEKLLESGLDVSPKEALRMHRLWRKNNAETVELWANLERAATELVSAGKGVRLVGRISMRIDARCLYVGLPGGRELHYWQPHLCEATRKVKVIEDSGAIVEKELERVELRFFREADDRKSMAWESTYGGRLAENFTQAVTRNLLAEALVRLRLSMYPVVLHVHDSIVAMVPTGTGSVGEFVQIMCTRPKWAEGFPVRAKGYRGRRFEG